MNGDKIESKPQVSQPSSLDQPVEDVVIKDSTLMLLGFAMVGKQCRNELHEGPANSPSAVCALGARNFAKYGTALPGVDANYCDFLETLDKALGCIDAVPHLNDVRKLSIPEIAAMLAEKGL